MKKGFNYWTLKEDIKGNKQLVFVLSLDHGGLKAIVEVSNFKSIIELLRRVQFAKLMHM